VIVGEIWGKTKLTHDVSLRPNGNQTVNMLLNRDKDLAGHMTTLFCAGGLILNVNSCGTLLDKELGELHDSSETTMSGVGIRDNWAKVVNVEEIGALFLGDAKTLLALFTIVEELGHEEMANLVGNGCLYAY
jgi:hypothetical protein